MSTALPPVAVRVISLAGSTERRASMTAQLDAVPGLDWAFHDAATALPPFLRHDGTTTRRLLARDLTRGELGCFASHAILWREHAAAADDAVMVVLEDDVMIDPQFLAALPVFAARLPNAGLVRLYAKAPAPATIVGFVHGRHIVRYRGGAYGTQAYLLRPTAARALARITTVVRPVDDEMDRFWQHSVPSLGVHPFPVLEIGFASTIEAARRTLPRPGMPGWWGWKRARIADSLARRAANLRYRFSETRL